MKNIISLTFISLALAAIGCGGAAISSELRTARDTVSEARGGVAARLEPDQLRAAERSLAHAEQAADGSAVERDLAYLADRQARIAVVNARRETNRQLLVSQQRMYQNELERTARTRQEALQTQQLALAEVQRELARVRTELQASGRALGERSEELAALESSLAAREQQLLEAERRAAEAMGRLAESENVRREQGRTIITLPGEVLFETNRAEIRPNARGRLAAVADALEAQPGLTIVVEGHTDARGNDTENEQLSQRRADAVRQFLFERGVPADRMRSLGRGEQDPIADNRTAEGRAENRRVEIELEPAA